jgi:hypothetical protein
LAMTFELSRWNHCAVRYDTPNLPAFSTRLLHKPQCPALP